VWLVDVPTAGHAGELRLEQVKMMINYWRQSENAAAYGKILGIGAQRHPLMSKYMLLKGDSGPMSTAGKPYSIPIALRSDRTPLRTSVLQDYQ